MSSTSGSWGTVTLRDEIVGEYATVRAPLEEVLAWALERARIRPGFKEFVDRARDDGWRVVVVSSGFNELIEPILEREGVEVESSPTESIRGGTAGSPLALRRGVPGVRPVVQARDRRAASPSGGELLYIGDGYSDRCAGESADRVFATGELAAHFESKGVPYEPFRDFDIASALAPARS